MSDLAKPTRYNLELSADLYAALQQVAEADHRPVAEMVRRFIKIGLMVHRVQQQPNGAILLREGDHERELMLL